MTDLALIALAALPFVGALVGFGMAEESQRQRVHNARQIAAIDAVRAEGLADTAAVIEQASEAPRGEWSLSRMLADECRKGGAQ